MLYKPVRSNNSLCFILLLLGGKEVEWVGHNEEMLSAASIGGLIISGSIDVYSKRSDCWFHWSKNTFLYLLNETFV